MTEAAEKEREIERGRKERADFIARVRKEEEHANRDSRGYRRKVYALVGIAYGYIFLLLAGSLGLFFYMLYLTLNAERGTALFVRPLIIVGIFAAVVIRSFWVRIKPPKGEIIKRGDAAKLYAEVDAIADRLKAPRPDEIRIDLRLNAAASQAPRLGMLGFYRNILVIGLPLMACLTPDEMRGVIAHEFGHFSGSHGKFGAWVYRVNQTWWQLGHQFSRRQSAALVLVTGFTKWFQPRFAATTFAMRRANEYEADQAGAEIVGAEVMANGLIRMQYLREHLRKTFWKPVNKLCRSNSLPPENCFASLEVVAKTPPESEMAEKELELALFDKTDYDDTHPCLTDRLRALGQLPPNARDAAARVLQPISTSSAEALLGPRLPSLLAQMSKFYQESAKDEWAKNHRIYQKHFATVERLRANAEKIPPTDKERIELAYAIYQLDGKEAGEREFRALRESIPTSPLVAFWLGSILADKSDPDAEPLLKEAAQNDPKLSLGALNNLQMLYRALGDASRLEGLQDQITDVQLRRQQVDSEARYLRVQDDFAHHGLAPEKIQDLVGQLRDVANLQKAFLVNKVLSNGEHRMVLVAFPKASFITKADEPKRLVEALVKLVYPERTTTYVPRQEIKNWERRLSAVPGSLIYESAK